MFGLDQSYSAEKTLSVLKENNLSNIVELGAGLGRDTIFFAKNSIKITALDYSKKGISIIDKKINDQNLNSSIRTLKFDVRKKLPFKDKDRIHLPLRSCIISKTMRYLGPMWMLEFQYEYCWTLRAYITYQTPLYHKLVNYYHKNYTTY